MAEDIHSKYRFNKDEILPFILECNEENGTYEVSDQYGFRHCYGEAYYKIRIVQKYCQEKDDDYMGFDEDPDDFETLMAEQKEKEESFDGCEHQEELRMTVKIDPKGPDKDLVPTIQGIVEMSFGITKMRKSPFSVQFVIPHIGNDPLCDPAHPRQIMLQKIAYEFLIEADGIGLIQNEDEGKLTLASEAKAFVEEAKVFEIELDKAIWEGRSLNRQVKSLHNKL